MNTLTLSGWAQPTDALSNALAIRAAAFDYSHYPDAQASFEGLKDFADTEHVIAWSLGGQLALRAIAAGVLRPKHLTLIAPPYQFMKSEDVAHGMDAQTFATFRDNYARDPQRTSSRFHALVAKGDAEMKRIMGLLGHHPHVTDTARWLPWFDDLGRTSLRDLDLRQLPPTLLVHGTEDAIVPFQQSQLLAEKSPSITLSRWQGVAHAPHLHDASRLLSEMAQHRTRAA